jgi:hypothetical protein
LLAFLIAISLKTAVFVAGIQVKPNRFLSFFLVEFGEKKPGLAG